MFNEYYAIAPSTPRDDNRRPGQIRFSHVQSSELERVFSVQKYITPQERKPLARNLDLSERQVKTWFQNRRAKWRRIKLEDEMRSQFTKPSGHSQQLPSGNSLASSNSKSIAHACHAEVGHGSGDVISDDVKSRKELLD